MVYSSPLDDKEAYKKWSFNGNKCDTSYLVGWKWDGCVVYNITQLVLVPPRDLTRKINQ